MKSPTSTRGWPVWTVGLVLLAGLLLVGLPAFGQALKVTSAVPSAADQGTLGLVVTIGGENFSSGAKVNFYVTGTTNPGGIAVKNVKFKDSQTLEATIDVALDAVVSPFDVQVKCNSRTGKGTELFKVNVKTTGGDLTPPGTVTDLTLVQTDFNTAYISWTAPANDGYDTKSGAAAQYDRRVRKATPECGPLPASAWMQDGASWEQSDPCAVDSNAIGTPALPGSTETFKQSSLAPNTSYWFALRTADASPQGPNWSAPSEPQLLFATASFPPPGWTAPWATEVVDAMPRGCCGGPPRLDFAKDTGYPLLLYARDYATALTSWDGVAHAWATELLPVAIDTGNYAYQLATDPVTGEVTIASVVKDTKINEVRFYRRIGAAWQTDVLASLTASQGNELSQVKLRMASPNIPTVAYGYAKGNTTLVRVAQQHGATWTTDTVASRWAGLVTLAVDPAGTPAVCYKQQSGTSNPLVFALKTGGVWTTEIPDSGGPGSPYSLNEIDLVYVPRGATQGDFAVAGRYYNSSTSTSLVRYCERSSGTWTCEQVGQEILLVGLYFAGASDGTVYLAYNQQYSNLIMNVRAAGTANWTQEYIDWNASVSPAGGLRIAPDGTPVIAYLSRIDANGQAKLSVSVAKRTP